MALIGLIADTHMPPRRPDVTRWVEQTFAEVDLILHAGDLAALWVLDWLETIAPVYCARGNNDRALPEDPRVAPYQQITVEGTRIGVIHILQPREWPIDRLAAAYKIDPLPDVLVCGDTHEEFIEWRDNVLVVNPGSPTLPSLRTDLPGTVALLSVGQDSRPNAWMISMNTESSSR